MIVPDQGDEIDEPVVYEDGETRPISTLVDDPPTLPAEDALRQNGTAKEAMQTETPDDDPDASIEVFAEDVLTEDDDSTLTTDEVYGAYKEWAAARDVAAESKNWFARRLGDHVDFERTSEYRDGKTVRCYEGIDLQEENR